MSEEVKKLSGDYVKLSYHEIMLYFFDFSVLLNQLAMIINIPIDKYMGTLLRNIAMEPRSIAEITDALDKEYELNIEEKTRIYECLGNISSVRFWKLGGKTLEEEQLKYFILDNKPEGGLNDCLKSLSSEAIENLYQRYDVDSLNELSQKIIENFFEEEYTLEDKELIIHEQGQEYDNIFISATDIVKGYFYLYRENNQLKTFIPKEIFEQLLENNWSAVDLVGAYMILNGIIKKRDLQTLLKDYHNQDWPIDKLDNVILAHDYYIINDYYFVLGDLTEFEEDMILKPKKGRKYRIFDENVREDLNLIDTVSEQIEFYLKDSSVTPLNQQYFLGTTMMLLQIGVFSGEALKSLMRENHAFIEQNIFHKIVDYVNVHKNDIPL